MFNSGAVYQMANKISNVNFDQIPHLIVNHPETDPYHFVIMTALFKVLKDNKYCIYSDSKLSENTKIPDRTIRRKLNDLEKWLFIKREGKGYNRRFYLGLAFDVEQIKFKSAVKAVCKDNNLNNTAVKAETPADKGKKPGHNGRQSNKILKSITNLISTDLTSTPKHPPYTKEESNLVEKYKQSLFDSNIRLEGIELSKAKILYKRHN